MPEFIDRQELIDNLNKFAPEHYNALVNQLIMKQPIADVVEVVRCKDCKKYYRIIGRDEREIWGCSHMGITVKANDFCSYGERKGKND